MDGLIAGRYRLLEHLGGGGQGQVWKAHDETLNIDVAVKAIHADNDGAGLRALAEARNAAALREHPNIVAVHDVVEDGGRPWMVMRLVDGRSLAEELQTRGALPVEDVVGIAAGVLSALAAAHAAGIIHRDIKPANIMIDRGGGVLLADFGIAKNHADTKLTATGSFIGTLDYLAPERFDGKPDAPAVDMWSLGATLFEAVEGISAFRGETPTATMSNVAFKPLPVPARAGRLTALLAALLDRDPQARPDAARALRMLAGDPAATTQTAEIPAGIGDILEASSANPGHPVKTTTIRPWWSSIRAVPMTGLPLTVLCMFLPEVYQPDEPNYTAWSELGRVMRDGPGRVGGGPLAMLVGLAALVPLSVIMLKTQRSRRLRVIAHVLTTVEAAIAVVGTIMLMVSPVRLGPGLVIFIAVSLLTIAAWIGQNAAPWWRPDGIGPQDRWKVVAAVTVAVLVPVVVLALALVDWAPTSPTSAGLDLPRTTHSPTPTRTSGINPNNTQDHGQMIGSGGRCLNSLAAATMATCRFDSHMQPYDDSEWWTRNDDGSLESIGLCLETASVEAVKYDQPDPNGIVVEKCLGPDPNGNSGPTVPSQQWIFNADGTIENTATRLCLSSAKGLSLRACNGTDPTQKFRW
ncbi:protein kinase [Streptacidiphilus sp. EB129]|uniref:protein kinase domain-containing protein n=1 Tax=Streptacidiphilus sp. EB129 TaxID=3156262 RepID=UPI003515996E